jgi:RimJ/RimL family protein N-acetyltransferase
MAWLDTEILTDRVRLRSFREGDKRGIVRLLTDPDVRRYLGGPVGDEQVTAVRSAAVGERWGAFCFADRSSDAVLGSCRFDRDRGELEVSYDLLPEHWGSGLAAEGVAAALGWAWSVTDDESVIAVTQTANERSLALLARLGFSLECEFEEFGAAQSQLRLSLAAWAG